MKAKFTHIISLFLLVSVTGYAQVSLEHVYSGAAEMADVEDAGYKYFVTNYLNNSITVYHEDHSYWKTIQLSVPQNQYLYDVAYLSSRLFNRDDQLELLMVTYRYITVTDTSGYYIYETRVVNESGSVLADVPGGGYSYTFTNSNNKNKLVVYIYDFSISDYIISTEIFGLPDPVNGINESSFRELMPYPNPADKNINLPCNVELKNGNNEVIVTDISGREISRKAANGHEGYVNIDTSSLPAGTYVYKIVNNGITIPGRKFIIK